MPHIMKTKWQGRRLVIEYFYPFVEQVRQIMKREPLLHLREGHQNAEESRKVADVRDKGGARELLAVHICPSRRCSKIGRAHV